MYQFVNIRKKVFLQKYSVNIIKAFSYNSLGENLMTKEKAFNFLSLTMFAVIIFLFINIFNSNYYFEFNKSNIAKFFTNTLNFKNLFAINKDQLVNKNIEYIQNNGLYYSETNEIYALEDGVIVKINSEEILIYQNNNYYLQYFGNFDVLIKKGDYIEKGTILGLTYNEFNIRIYDNEKFYTYEEYLQITI